MEFLYGLLTLTKIINVVCINSDKYKNNLNLYRSKRYNIVASFSNNIKITFLIIHHNIILYISITLVWSLDYNILLFKYSFSILY